MEDIFTYRISVRGRVAEADIAPFSPPGLRVAPNGETCTVLIIHTDQSGLIGMLRQLHGLGLVLLSFETDPKS